MAYQSLVERRDWFLEQNKIHSDEDKRPNRKISGLDQMEGSFRKIAIDWLHLGSTNSRLCSEVLCVSRLCTEYKFIVVIRNVLDLLI